MREALNGSLGWRRRRQCWFDGVVCGGSGNNGFGLGRFRQLGPFALLLLHMAAAVLAFIVTFWGTFVKRFRFFVNTAAYKRKEDYATTLLCSPVIDWLIDWLKFSRCFYADLHFDFFLSMPSLSTVPSAQWTSLDVRGFFNRKLNVGSWTTYQIIVSRRTANEWIQSINQSINQSDDRSINQWVIEPTNQSINRMVLQ